jgi:hypothetical protein
VNPQYLHFSEHAIVPAKQVGVDGKCTFYEVEQKDLCPYKEKTWLKQAGGTNVEPLRLILGPDFNHCVNTIEVPCISPATLLRNSGLELVFDENTSTHCLKESVSAADEARVDILVVDVEGSDGAVINAYLEELCPKLWPAVILYEDKVMRGSELHRSNTTTLADSVVENLEGRGYYVHIIGEDVIGFRVGYSIRDFKHMPYYDEFVDLPWLHPFSTRSLVPQYYVASPLRKDKDASA